MKTEEEKVIDHDRAGRYVFRLRPPRSERGAVEARKVVRGVSREVPPRLVQR